MTIKIDLARLREQAMQMQTQMPELFAYLRATASMVQTIAHSIPHPDDLPQIEIPFIDAVIELSQAKKRCPICDPPDPDELWVLSPRQALPLLPQRYLSAGNGRGGSGGWVTRTASRPALRR
jgi:hypothetical protein